MENVKVVGRGYAGAQYPLCRSAVSIGQESNRDCLPSVASKSYSAKYIPYHSQRTTCTPPETQKSSGGDATPTAS